MCYDGYTKDKEEKMSFSEVIYAICQILLPSALIGIIIASVHYIHKDKIYRSNSTGWLSVKEYPIPEDIRDFLATDGNKVVCLYKPKWGPHGKVHFGEYDKTHITHWQPLPDVPK